MAMLPDRRQPYEPLMMIRNLLRRPLLQSLPMVWIHAIFAKVVEMKRSAIWSRAALPVGSKIAGPAVLEQPDATVFLEPGFVATVDTWGNVIIERAGS